MPVLDEAEGGLILLKCGLAPHGSQARDFDHPHMGNFNILTTVKYNSEDNCKILYFDKALSVLYKFLS